jgi:hypothetical protein
MTAILRAILQTIFAKPSANGFCFPLDLSTLRAIPKPRAGPCPYGWSVQRGWCVRLWSEVRPNFLGEWREPRAASGG